MAKTKPKAKPAAKTKAKTEDKVIDITELVNDEFGAGTILSMAGADTSNLYEVFQTGSLGLDDALGIGGLPRGRIVEIYGPESSGKTTLCLHVIADAMKKGHRCAFIDAEHALDIKYAQNLGVDLKKMLVCQPDNGEQALNVCEKIVKSGQCPVIVIDSVAALTPKDELEGEVGAYHVGKQARMMSQALRKLVAAVAVHDVLLIFINQERSKIGGMGNPNTTTGGNALKYYSSIRLRIVRTGSTSQGEEKVANTTKVKVVKNKVAPPFKEVEFEIEFGRGISLEGEIIDMGLKTGDVKKAGAWYSRADGTRLGQGKENVKTCLRNDHKLRNDLLQTIRASSKA